jgi:uncharacterized damage-inducible protein DinB
MVNSLYEYYFRYYQHQNIKIIKFINQSPKAALELTETSCVPNIPQTMNHVQDSMRIITYILLLRKCILVGFKIWYL